MGCQPSGHVIRTKWGAGMGFDSWKEVFHRNCDACDQYESWTNTELKIVAFEMTHGR